MTILIVPMRKSKTLSVDKLSYRFILFTYIELQSRVEIFVWDNIHLGHEGVHVPLVGHQPDDGWLSTGLVLGLGIILKPLANIVNCFG